MPELVSDRRQVAEIDKYAVLPEHRGKYVNDLVAAAVLVAREHGIRDSSRCSSRCSAARSKFCMIPR